MKAFLFIRAMYRRHPLLLSAGVLLWVAVGLFEAASVFSIAPVVDFVVHPDLSGASPVTLRMKALLEAAGLHASLWSALAIFIGFSAMKSLGQVSCQYLALRTKYAIERDLYVGSFEDFFNARWHFFASSRQGELLNTFLRAMNLVGEASGQMATFFSSCLMAAMYLAVPIYLSWKTSLLSMGAMVLLGAPFLLAGRMTYRLGKLNVATGKELDSLLQESLSMAKIILGYGNHPQVHERLDRAFLEHQGVTIKSQMIGASIPNLYFPLGLMVVAMSLLAGKRFGMPLSESAALLYALFKVVPCVVQAVTAKNSLENSYPCYEQIAEIRQRARGLKQESGAKRFPGLRQEIRFEGLSFAHPGHAPTLRELSLAIPKGQMIAFAGESGAGKSTLIDVVMGFNAPTQGRITVDGAPLQELDIVSYRRRIGYVPQDAVLFNASVRENLRWALESAGDSDIEAACAQAHADGFIRGMPQGYDTVLGDRGVRLSGGQAQRIALARAILRKPEILILDEATSSLDTQSERLIQQAIEELAKQTTVIVIAHRLSTIVHADEIFVLERGRIAEHGRYEELLRRDGLFARMARLQDLGQPVKEV